MIGSRSDFSRWAAWLGAGMVLMSSSAASAQLVDTTLEASEDRWNYPFNLTPGPRPFASTFGAINLPGFDDYDAQFIVGFDTSQAIPPGLGIDQYRVLDARLRIWVTEGERIRFDPTFDSFTTYLPQDDPEFSPDEDTGRPIVAYGTGYRGINNNTGEPWSIDTWFESAPFGGVPEVEPAQGSRFAFTGWLDADGEVIDVSNRLKDRFDPAPIGVAAIPGVEPGQFVPADTEVVIELDPCRGGGAFFLREGLDAGVVRISVGSLHAAAGGPGGPDGDPNFPEFYTRENPLAPVLGFTPTLELRARAGDPADLTGPGGDGAPDGSITADDFFFYLGLFAASDPAADLTGPGGSGLPDCSITADDFFFYLGLFSQG